MYNYNFLDNEWYDSLKNGSYDNMGMENISNMGTSSSFDMNRNTLMNSTYDMNTGINSNFDMNGNTIVNSNFGLNRNMGMNTNKNMPSLFTPEEGYNNGNLFSNLYSQYKNYKPVILKARNDREKILLDLSRFAFAAHELNLYLDVNPDDSSMIALFNDYRKRAIELQKQYESLYGPLTINSDNLEQTPFMWENEAWPWEGNAYV